MKCGNRYPPRITCSTFQLPLRWRDQSWKALARAGLNHSQGGWARIILEKPFGHDLKSAQELNAIVHKSFDEKDVFRIDHYLGKETVQNILVFRFGNSLFEPVWNRNYIDFVEITAAETVGVESRAGFYEETGALRDMVANHMLQLLALTAMEPPIEFEADSVRGQKVQALKSIRPMTVEEVAKRTVRGQYGPGEIGGKRVAGYREEPGVKKDSVTETYAAVEFYVDNWRWAGVPFFIRTGKHLARQVLRNSRSLQTHAAGALRQHALRAAGAERDHTAHPAGRRNQHRLRRKAARQSYARAYGGCELLL